MPKEQKSIPEYVDTKTPSRQWLGYNLTILAANIVMIGIASLVIEYELAKMAHPEANFLPTPTTIDLTLGFLIIALGVANLGVLLFVFLRHLWLRRWMMATTWVGWILLAVLVLVMSKYFLPVILPWYR